MEYGDYGAGLYGIGDYGDGHWFLYESQVGGAQRSIPTFDVAMARQRTPLDVDMRTATPILTIDMNAGKPIPNIAMTRTYEEI